MITSYCKIPKILNNLIKLKSVERKSANVIIRELNKKPECIFVDYLIIRVVPRVGLTPKIKNGNKVEKLLTQNSYLTQFGTISEWLFPYLGKEI